MSIGKFSPVIHKRNSVNNNVKPHFAGRGSEVAEVAKNATKPMINATSNAVTASLRGNVLASPKTEALVREALGKPQRPGLNSVDGIKKAEWSTPERRNLRGYYRSEEASPIVGGIAVGIVGLALTGKIALMLSECFKNKKILRMLEEAKNSQNLPEQLRLIMKVRDKSNEYIFEIKDALRENVKKTKKTIVNNAKEAIKDTHEDSAELLKILTARQNEKTKNNKESFERDNERSFKRLAKTAGYTREDYEQSDDAKFARKYFERKQNKINEKLKELYNLGENHGLLTEEDKHSYQMLETPSSTPHQLSKGARSASEEDNHAYLMLGTPSSTSHQSSRDEIPYATPVLSGARSASFDENDIPRANIYQY